MSDAAGQARARGWVTHLRAGGTTPWAQWRTPGDPTGRVIPGAQQLELLRRINLAAPSGRVEERLVERVLTADAPGRGLPDLELVGAATDDRFGTPAVDPADLPSDEILRSAAHLVAQDLVALDHEGLGPVDRARTARRRRLLRRPRVVVGDPWMRSEIARELAARGRAPVAAGSSTRTPVVVVGADLETMLGDVWTHACFDSAVVSWTEWLGHWGRRPGLPASIDLARVAARSADSGRAQVVVDERDLPRALGVRRLPPVRRPSRTAAELARRIGGSLSLVAAADQAPTLLREGFAARLPEDLFDTDLPTVPADAHPWVSTRGARLADQLLAAGYPVAGRSRSLDLTSAPEPPRTSDADGALDLAVRLLLGGWREPQ